MPNINVSATLDDVQGYIQIATILAAQGVAIVGKFKDFLNLFRPEHGLTDEQINAIEQMGVIDSQRRRLERIAMGVAS